MDESKKPCRVISIAPVIASRRKSCRCENPQYEVDPTSRKVHCTQCGHIVDPIDALMNLAEDWKGIHKWQERQKRVAKMWLTITKRKPWQQAMKGVEQRTGERKEIIPCCPHCGKGFHKEEVNTYVNAKICENKGWARKT